MRFPLSLYEISLWIAVTTIVLLTTSEVLLPWLEETTNVAIHKKHFRLVALLLGATFALIVLVWLVTEYL